MKLHRVLAISLAGLLALPLTPASFAQDPAKPDQDAKQDSKKDNKKKSSKSKDDVEEIGNRDVGKGMNWYSLEKEIAIGKALAQQVEAQSKLIDDPVINEYVNRVGQNLVRNSDAKVPFTIKVIDADEVNAFALPGGFFFVNSGLILEADEEAEMAGAMAHEIAHVAARHGTRQATRGELINYMTIPLIFMGGIGPYIGRQAAGLIIPIGFMKFAWNCGLEAAGLGLTYTYKTGYDPNAFVSFFEKIQAKEKRKPGTLSKLFASHPQTPDRISASQQEIARVLPAREEYLVTTSEFDDVKGRLEMIHNRRRLDDKKNSDRPTLRKSTTASADPVDEKNKKAEDTKADDKDGRPTLKRRDN